MDQVRIGDRCSVHLQDVVHQVDDPVVGHAGPGVEAGVLPAVERETGERDLDDKSRSGRMRRQVVTRRTGQDGDVGLGLRLLVQGDRQLGFDRPPGAKCRAQGRRDQADAGGLRAPLSSRTTS